MHSRIDVRRWHRLLRFLEGRERQGPLARRLRVGRLERKFKYRTADGCEVERKWKKGEYEEKVKCKPGRYGYGYRPALPLSTRKEYAVQSTGAIV
jgi:hypothetical protein